MPSTSTAHGTHVAGTALARGDDGFGVSGVSQRGSLMVLKVCSGDGCAQAAQIRAINYAAAEGAKVLNGSLGGFNTVESASRRAAIFSHPETLYVFAAGNENSNSDNQPSECAGASPCKAYPCAHAPVAGETDNTLCVAATTPTDNRAGFSNFGATSVDLGAPGTSTLSDSAFRRRFSDNFSGAFSWTAVPGQTNWVSALEPPLTTTGITEQSGNYLANVTYGTNSPTVNVPPGSGECELSYLRARTLGAGDTFRIQVVRDGFISPARTLEYDSADNVGLGSFTFDLGDTLVAGGAVQVRLTLISNNDALQGSGIVMDNIELRCAESPSDNGLLFLQGTSMAAPHVTGAAGLLFSRNPGAGATEIRDKLLATVDPNAALSGITTSGGRLNIGTAMSCMPADTAITSGPGEGEEIGARRGTRRAASPPGAAASFGVSSNDPAAGFQCSVDAAAFAACGAGGTATVGPLGPGPHTFAVRSLDPRGNADTTPVTRSFTVESDPPETRIVKGPRKRTTASKAKFRFTSDEPGSTFECKFDRKPFAPCSSPRKLKKVKAARHKFLVRAIDGVGNVDRTAAKKRWRVTLGRR